MLHMINSRRLSHYASRAFLTTVAAVLLSLLCLPEAAADRRAAQPPAQRSATTYYVAPYGNNDHSGTETQPLATIAKAVEKAVVPGDTVSVRKGNYVLESKLIISASGKEDAWITIQSYPGETAVIDGSKLPTNSDTVEIGGRYVAFSNFEVRNSSRTGLAVWGSSHVRISGNVIHDCVRGGIWVGHDQVGLVSDISIDGNTVYNTCLVNSAHTTSGGWPGAIVSEKARDIAVKNNRVYGNHGEGVIFILTDHGRASGNVVYDNYSVGMYLDNARFCLVEKNLIYSTGDKTFYRRGHPAVGIAAANEIYDVSIPLSNNTVINNVVINGRFGFEFYNFDGPSKGGGMKNSLIANNTFFKGTVGIIKLDDHSEHHNNTFANNIFYQVGGATTAVIAPNPANYFYRNCWYGGGSWPAGPGDINVDPKLINPGSYAAADYQLQPDSPCIAKGMTITGVREDYLSRERVIPYDIGAFKHNQPPNPNPIPPREEPFKVVTYNIASGAHGVWRKQDIDFDRLADHILQQNPDIVVLQEVHDNYTQGRRPVRSQPEYWRTRLGMNGHYMADYKAWSFWGYSLGTSGHMILSKWPIVQVDDDLRPRTDTGAIGFGIGIEKFEDNKMSVVLDIRGRRVRVGAMHLGGRQRLIQYLDWLERFPEPAILAGDANLDLSDLNGPDWQLQTAGARFVTIPNGDITDHCRRIDWIMVQRGILKIDAWDYGRINGQCVIKPSDRLSDHPLVYASVSFEPVAVRNPGFETRFDGWSKWSPSAKYYADWFANCGHSGFYCGAQFGAGGVIYRDLTGLVPGVRYEISAWFLGGPQSLGKLIAHNTLDENYVGTPYMSGQGSYVKMSLVYTADQTGRVRVHFERSNSSSFDAPTVWDDLTVTPIDPP